MKQYRKNIGVLENARDSVGPRKRSVWPGNLAKSLSCSLTLISCLDHVM